MKSLIEPAPEVIDYYNKSFNSNTLLKEVDEGIKAIFKLYPQNLKLSEILTKASILNQLYNTNIFSITRLSQHIQNLAIDEALYKGEADLVNIIAKGHGIINSKTNKERCFYSFATKYCSWHFQEEFPIYDQYVHKLLFQYSKKWHFSKFAEKDLKHYPRLKAVILEFQKHFGLEKFKFKEIDKFFWLYGQEVYKSYAPSNTWIGKSE